MLFQLTGKDETLIDIKSSIVFIYLTFSFTYIKESHLEDLRNESFSTLFRIHKVLDSIKIFLKNLLLYFHFKFLVLLSFLKMFFDSSRIV